MKNKLNLRKIARERKTMKNVIENLANIYAEKTQKDNINHLIVGIIKSIISNYTACNFQKEYYEKDKVLFLFYNGVELRFYSNNDIAIEDEDEEFVIGYDYSNNKFATNLETDLIGFENREAIKKLHKKVVVFSTTKKCRYPQKK